MRNIKVNRPNSSERDNAVRNLSLFIYMEDIVVKLRDMGRTRTSETYIAALRSFKKFRKGQDLMLESLTSDILETFEAWLKNNGNVPNTISFYMRILRASYNRAVEDGLVEDRKPFRKVYTGVDKTVKRAISIEAVGKLKRIDLSGRRVLDFARDMFLMSFYLRGISFIDLAYLKKSDLRNGYLTYRRRKTGQLLTIKWTFDMQELLDKYPDNPTEYLMPIITADCINHRNSYRNQIYNINRNLKRIAPMIGITIPLTMYVARHSWASAAKVMGIPVSVISEGMGHDSESTTQIYLASLETSVIDNANSLIISSL